MVFQCINIRKIPWEVLKTAAFGLVFQHLPRDLANVNACKTMFDPYNQYKSSATCAWSMVQFFGGRKHALIYVRTAKMQIGLISAFIVRYSPFLIFDGKAPHKHIWKAKWFSEMY